MRMEMMCFKSIGGVDLMVDIYYLVILFDILVVFCFIGMFLSLCLRNVEVFLKRVIKFEKRW